MVTTTRSLSTWSLVFCLAAIPVQAQDIPVEYQAVMTALAKKGDYKDGVLKVNIPRGDLTVTIAGRPAPTPFGFGGWVALTPGDGPAVSPAERMQVLMGDLVLTEDEVNPVMTALLGEPQRVDDVWLWRVG